MTRIPRTRRLLIAAPRCCSPRHRPRWLRARRTGGAGDRGNINGGNGTDTVIVTAGIGFPTGEAQTDTGSLDGGADTDVCQLLLGSVAGSVTNCEL